MGLEALQGQNEDLASELEQVKKDNGEKDIEIEQLKNSLQQLESEKDSEIEKLKSDSAELE